MLWLETYVASTVIPALCHSLFFRIIVGSCTGSHARPPSTNPFLSFPPFVSPMSLVSHAESNVSFTSSLKLSARIGISCACTPRLGCRCVLFRLWCLLDANQAYAVYCADEVRYAKLQITSSISSMRGQHIMNAQVDEGPSESIEKTSIMRQFSNQGEHQSWWTCRCCRYSCYYARWEHLDRAVGSIWFSAGLITHQFHMVPDLSVSNTGVRGFPDSRTEWGRCALQWRVKVVWGEDIYPMHHDLLHVSLCMEIIGYSPSIRTLLRVEGTHMRFVSRCGGKEEMDSPR